jgi:hypothetical protein
VLYERDAVELPRQVHARSSVTEYAAFILIMLASCSSHNTTLLMFPYSSICTFDSPPGERESGKFGETYARYAADAPAFLRRSAGRQRLEDRSLVRISSSRQLRGAGAQAARQHAPSEVVEAASV